MGLESSMDLRDSAKRKLDISCDCDYEDLKKVY